MVLTLQSALVYYFYHGQLPRSIVVVYAFPTFSLNLARLDHRSRCSWVFWAHYCTFCVTTRSPGPLVAGYHSMGIDGWDLHATNLALHFASGLRRSSHTSFQSSGVLRIPLTLAVEGRRSSSSSPGTCRDSLQSLPIPSGTLETHSFYLRVEKRVQMVD